MQIWIIWHETILLLMTSSMLRTPSPSQLIKLSSFIGWLGLTDLTPSPFRDGVNRLWTSDEYLPIGLYPRISCNTVHIVYQIHTINSITLTHNNVLIYSYLNLKISPTSPWLQSQQCQRTQPLPADSDCNQRLAMFVLISFGAVRLTSSRFINHLQPNSIYWIP